MKRNKFVRSILVFASGVAVLSGYTLAFAQSVPPVLVQVPFISVGAGNVISGESSTSPSSSCSNDLKTTGGDSYGDGCPASEAGISDPWGVATDSWGNVYFGDEGHDYLRVIYAGATTVNGVPNPATAMIEAANVTHVGLIPEAGTVYALAGGLTGALANSTCSTTTPAYTSTVTALTSDGSGCPATLSYIKGAYGASVDSTGNVFVLDKSNSVVYVVLANTTGLAAQLVTLENPSVTAPQIGYIYQIIGGGGGYKDGVLANNGGEVHAPEGVAVDTNDSVYIGDVTNNAVRMINGPTTTAGGYAPGFVHTIAGDCTSSSCTALAGLPSSGVAALGAAFDAPAGVAVDPSGNVYIADNSAGSPSNVPSTVRVIYAGGTSNPIANLICLEDSSISGCLTSLATGDIYTVAGGATSTSNSSATGNGALATSSSVEFDRIQGLALDPHGNIYIADYGSHSVIAKLNADTGYLVYLAGDGQTSFASGDYCTTGATTGPTMSDNYGDGCPGPQSITDHVEGNLAVDPSGNIYFADEGDGLVRKLTFTSEGSIGGIFPATTAGTPAASQNIAFTLLTGSSSLPATNVSVAVLTQGTPNAEYTDTGTGDTCTGSTTLTGASSSSDSNPNTVCVVPITFTPTKVGSQVGAVQITATINSIAQVFGTTYLHGIGNGAALVIDPSESTIIGSATAPQGVATDSSGDTYIASADGTISSTPAGSLATPITGNTSNPHQIAVDGAGNVYVADTGNNRIAEFVVGATSPISIGNGLSAPKGVALDSAGNLYIADTGNQRVLFQPNGNGTQTIVGSGFNNPIAIAVDANNNVYVADSGLGSIIKISAGTGTQTNLLSGIAPIGLTVDAAGDLDYVDSTLNEVVELPLNGSNDVVVTGLTTPMGVALDPNGGLYVADSANAGISYYNRTSSTQVFANSSSALSATLTNIGNQSFTATNDGFTQTDSTDFSVTPSSSDGCNFASPLPAGTACGESVLFTPVSTGDYSDTVTFSGNAVNTSGVTLNLSGDSTTASAGSTTTVLSGLTPATPTYGQSVQVTVMVSATSGTTIPSGTVVFYVNNVAQPPVTLVSGTYTLVLPSLSAGTNTISATYTSTNNFSPSSTTSILSFNVAPLAIAATITSPTTAVYGQPIPTITGTLSGVLPQDAANVAVMFSTTATSTSAAGTYPITAVLSGSAAGNYTVTPTTATFTITPAPTTTALTSSATSVADDSAVTLTATVTSTSSGTPSGTVTFSSGSTTLGTETLSGGVATLTTNSLPVGTLSVTAAYGGSTDYAPSTSAGVNETVSLAVVTGTLSASTVTIPAGSTGTVTLSLVAGIGYTGTGTYSCTMLPVNMACSFAPASSTFTSTSTTASSIITISTKGGSSTASAMLSRPARPGWPSSNALILAAGLGFPGVCIVFCGIGRRRRSLHRGVMSLVVIFASLAGIASLSGCSSSSSNQTPAGTYTIQVEVTAGTVQTIPLTVVVQ